MVRLEGESFGSASIYDSFEILPSALMDNAVKYSVHGQVVVRFTESGKTIRVDVESRGPLIEPDEMGSIFSRGFRGKWAIATVPKDGSGLGLFAANVVAKAHGTRIEVSSVPMELKGSVVPIALNTFSFLLLRVN